MDHLQPMGREEMDKIVKRYKRRKLNVPHQFQNDPANIDVSLLNPIVEGGEIGHNEEILEQIVVQVIPK